MGQTVDKLLAFAEGCQQSRAIHPNLGLNLFGFPFVRFCDSLLPAVNIMPRPLSNDLRKRIVESVQSGQSCRAAARHYAVAPSSIIKIMARFRKDGTYEPKPMGGHTGRGKLAPYRGVLLAMVAEEPDMTLSDISEALWARHGVSVSLAGRVLFSEKARLQL